VRKVRISFRKKVCAIKYGTAPAFPDLIPRTLSDCLHELALVPATSVAGQHLLAIQNAYLAQVGVHGEATLHMGVRNRITNSASPSDELADFDNGGRNVDSIDDPTGHAKPLKLSKQPRLLQPYEGLNILPNNRSI